MHFEARCSKLIFLCGYFLSLNPGTSGTATILPMNPFNLPEVTKKMVEAIKKNDGKRKDVNAILSKLVYWQRMQLADAYEEATGGNTLIDDIKKDIEQDSYKRLIDSMFSSEMEIYVNDMSRAFDGNGTNEKAVVEICVKITASKQTKKAFRDLYRKFHKLQPIEQAIKSETSGDFRNVLYEILSPYRPRDPPQQQTDDKLAQSTAELLKKTTVKAEKFVRVFGRGYEKKWFLKHLTKHKMCTKFEENVKHTLVQSVTQSFANLILDLKLELDDLKDDRKDIDRFLIQTNFSQLHLTLEKFKNINDQKTLETELKDRLDKDKKIAYVDLCRYGTDFVSYIAIRLKESLNSDDFAVIRNIVIEAERDLVEVKAKYLQDNNETLNKRISDTTEGIYKDLLLLIVGPEK